MTNRSPELALALAVGVATVALWGVLWSVDYLPTHDGPQHVFQGYLANHYGEEGTRYALYYDRAQPVTAVGFSVLYSAFERLMPWRAALRVSLAIVCTLWAWSYLALVRRVCPERVWVGLLGFASALGWALFMGLFPYVLSLALGFLLTAVAVGGRPHTPRVRVMLGLLLTLQAWVHVFGALASGLVLTLLAAFEPSSKRRWRELGWLALIAIPTVVCVAMLSGAHRMEASSTWLGLLDQLELAPRVTLGGPWWRGGVMLMLGALGIFSGAVRAIGGTASAPEKALLVSSALLMALGIGGPLHLETWQFFAPRFLPLAALLGAALLPIDRLPRRPQQALAALLFVHALASLAWARGFVKHTRERIDEALGGLDDGAHRSGPRLTVVLDPYAGLAEGWGEDAASWRGVEVPYYAPLFNLGIVYALDQGGLPSHLFAHNPRIHAFVKSERGRAMHPPEIARESLRDKSVLDAEDLRRELVTWIGLAGRGYEDVLLFGEPADVEQLETRGYGAITKRARLFVGAFRGCEVRAIVEGVKSNGPPLYLDHGFGRQALPPQLPVRPHGGAGRIELLLRRTLCGHAWVRVLEDRDESGGPSDGDGVCAGADLEGKLFVTLHPSTEVRCRL